MFGGECDQIWKDCLILKMQLQRQRHYNCFFKLNIDFNLIQVHLTDQNSENLFALSADLIKVIIHVLLDLKNKSNTH